jgi:hypothetical protein
MPTQSHSPTMLWKCAVAPQATMPFIQAIVTVRGLSVRHLQHVSDLMYLICQTSVPRRLVARQSTACSLDQPLTLACVLAPPSSITTRRTLSLDFRRSLHASIVCSRVDVMAILSHPHSIRPISVANSARFFVVFEKQRHGPPTYMGNGPGVRRVADAVYVGPLCRR